MNESGRSITVSSLLHLSQILNNIKHIKEPYHLYYICIQYKSLKIERNKKMPRRQVRHPDKEMCQYKNQVRRSKQQIQHSNQKNTPTKTPSMPSK